MRFVSQNQKIDSRVGPHELITCSFSENNQSLVNHHGLSLIKFDKAPCAIVLLLPIEFNWV